MMKGIYKRVLSLAIMILMVLSLFSGIRISVEAVSVYYQTVDTEKYKGVVKNWGQRGEVSSFLSPMAEDFYDDLGITYDDFMALSNDVLSDAYYASDLAENIRNLTLSALVKDPSYDDSRYLYQYTDIQRNGELNTAISSFYDGGLIGPAWDGTTWNREHVWPQSLGGPDDIIMLRPSDSKINSGRNNTGFGESSGFYNPNKTSNGLYDVRGDVARVALYVYVRYGESDEEIRTNLFGQTGEYGPEFESCAILLKWMEEDPVDTWEMGRNDSVQSITGTRNMFVDYPELAFRLFDEDIPAGYMTPSGEGYGDVGYTVTATSANLDYGTVEVNGPHITAIPAPGYALDSYSVTSGQATLSNDGNLIFVDAQGDCSVQVRFKKADKINISFIENGALKSVHTSEAGATFRMPAGEETIDSQYTFLGWAPEYMADTVTAPSALYAVGTDVVVYDNTTFCAVYSWVGASDDQESSTTVWELVTDSAQLALNKQLFITAANEDYALSTNQKTNNRGQTTIAKNTEEKTATPTEDTEILTLVSGTVSGTYALQTSDGKYLFASGNNSNNYLKSQTNINQQASWIISVDENGNASVVAQGTNTNVNMRYNSTSDLFSCYKSGQQNISLYVATQHNAATHYTTDIRGLECGHDSLITVAIDPTCLIRGYSYLYCDDCDAVTEVTDFVACTAHSWTQWTATDSSDGEQTRYCTYCAYTQNTVVPQQTADPFHSYNLVLGDDIAMNILLELSDTQASDGAASVTVGGITTDYDELTSLPTLDGKYMLTIHLAAAQMTDSVAVELQLADGCTEKEYSVAEYAAYILEDTTGEFDQKTKDLVLAMLHYGAAAQQYFGYNTGNLANDGWADTVTNIPDEATYSAKQNTVEGIAHYGSTLLHRENIATRFYFTLTADKTIDAFTVKYGNSVLTSKEKDGLYYVEIDGILPQNLDREVAVTVNDTMVITYSPLCYIYSRYNDTEESAVLKTMVQQLYDYHLAAKAYTAQ